MLQSGTKGKQCVPQIVLPFDDMKRGPLLKYLAEGQGMSQYCNNNCKYERTDLLRQSKACPEFLFQIEKFKSASNKQWTNTTKGQWKHICI